MLKFQYNFNKKSIGKAELGLRSKEIREVIFPARQDDSMIDVTLLCMQGMLNRVQPTVYINYDGYYGAVGHFGGEVPASTREFQSYFKKTRKLRFFEPQSADTFLQTTASLFNGIILFNHDDRNSVVASVNIAAANLCLPLSEIDYKNRRGVFDGLTIVDKIDLSAVTTEEVYRTLLENVMPYTDKSGGYNLGYRFSRADGSIQSKYHVIGLDYAVMKQHFIFMLSCNEQGRGGYDFWVEGSDREYALFSDVLSSFDAPAALMGWNEPEWRWALTATRFNHFVYCTDDADNLSFLASVPVSATNFVFNKGTNDMVSLKNKVYISIVSNEGDTPKMASQLYNNGWLKKRRGDYPANWSFNPEHVKRFPALAEYYLTTKCDNDYFIMAPNGAGYNNLKESRNAEIFLDYTAKLNQKTKFTQAELWYADKNALQQYIQTMPQLDGITIEPCFSQRDGEVFSLDGKTVIRHPERLYYWYTKGDLCSDYQINKEKTDNYLNALYNDGMPKFVTIYGYEASLIDNFADYADTLDKNKFEIVDYHTLFRLAGQVARPIDTCYRYPNAVRLWDNDSTVTDRSVWEVWGEDCEFWVDDAGVHLKISENARAKALSFRNDMLSLVAGRDKCAAMVRVNGVVVPQNADNLQVRVSSLSDGACWMLWMYGDYDGFGRQEKWEPFWKVGWAGIRQEEIPKRVREYYPKASDCLILCVIGDAGDEAVFENVTFIKRDEIC